MAVEETPEPTVEAVELDTAISYEEWVKNSEVAASGE